MPLLSRLAVQAARAYGILSAADKNKVVADYLVVAGGGSGASQDNEGGGGGGGAGGFRTSAGTSGGGASAESAITLSTLNTYTIAVGAGGAQATPVVGVSPAVGNDGSSSSISGTGLTTITSAGGGGGAWDGTGRSGGSGGGIERDVNATNTTGTGTTGQGFAGGNIVNNTGYQVGSGGGGAGAVGANGTGSGSSVAGGNGGAGVASSISGSSVTYAGGGGGSSDNRISNTLGSGGAGGGGAATNGTGTRATAGTANRGGGGGGSGGAGSGSGGSGIVIISYTSATPKFVGGTITTSGGKQIHTFTSSGTLSPITPITASYLVVAGGGGGGSGYAGGGGAGGYQTSSTTIYSGATYVVTVGAGGAGGTGSNSGVQGSNSVLSGTGITTVTSTGGGYGAAPLYLAAGGNGGSGGGSTSSGTAGLGTSGQGNNGGVGSSSSPYVGGAGGGGASAAGSNGSGSGGGNGGNGTASSISGTSITYAGGGGGGTFTAGTAGTGGTGGGGNGSNSAVVAISGTPNLGGGGGGGFQSSGGTNYGGGAGGSGIVIISYAGSQAFNGGLVTTSGGNTIHTFTSTGALTPLTNNLNNSLRFRSSASATLSRTPTSSTNRRTWTWSNWIKRGNLGIMRLCGAASSSTNETSIYFDSNNKLAFVSYIGSENARLITTQVFRDPSAWYHIVVTVDTTQATAANRIKMYVNGNQVTAFDTATYPSQNYETIVNSTTAHYYGTFDTSYYYDGYVTDAILIDGQALEPYYFGNNDANGVWKPIQYRGTYGTNGFYLTFGNTTSTTTLGYDSSPNGNNWTCNNISLTAGTTYDAMTDVPTNTSATVANYCVLNSLIPVTTTTVTNGNLSLNAYNPGGSVFGTMGVSSGKWYFESISQSDAMSGISGTLNGGAFPGAPANAYTWDAKNAQKISNSTSASYGSAASNGDIIGVAFDLDTGSITFYKNGVSQGVAYTFTPSGNYFPVFRNGDPAGSPPGGNISVNFGQRPFSYTPPTGYVALNTYNLPTPTILQGNKYMDATTYTGNSAPSNTIVNAGQFKPDFIWWKARNQAWDHNLQDSVRGTTKYLRSNNTNAEGTVTDGLLSFNSNGFTVGAGGDWNSSSANIVAWQWQAGQGSTSSNTNGSITSTVSVNTTAGFSVVTYTGTGANATVGHGLGVAPKMIIVKGRTNVDNWQVYHSNLTSAAFRILLNSTAAETSQPAVWNSTAPTSSVFSLGAGASVNQNGQTFVAYCWAEIAGFSKFGSYTGNGSTNGPFVYTGFRPKFLMFKTTTIIGHWVIVDTSRNTYNVIDNSIYPDTAGSEINTITDVDFLSNGFKWRGVLANETNVNGEVYIYMAFAENPFKNSNAR